MRNPVLAATIVALLGAVAGAQEPAVQLSIDTTKVQRQVQPQRFVATNVAVWDPAEAFADWAKYQPERGDGEAPFRFSMVRLPGGSYSDMTFWNGNGPRDAKTGKVDPTRMKDGYPDIDYSDYAPTILVEGHSRKVSSSGWHGQVDVKVQHEFARKYARDTFVCVNGGTGRASDAAEWVRWANKKQGYSVRYWEVGQELNGDWEAGHFLPDGKELTAAMYAARFKEFAKAMKAVDPTIRVGGPGTGVDDGGFLEALLRDAGEDVDFVSIHTYPGSATLGDDEQFARALVAREEVAKARKWIRQYQPKREGQIEVAYSEWNLAAPHVLWDLDGALWSALFLREAAVQGVDFAIQWDMFGAGEEGGMGLVPLAGSRRMPRSQFWALLMWARNTGGQVLSFGKLGQTPVEYLATRDERNLYVMLVNTSREQEVGVQLTAAGVEPSRQGRIEQLTYREYFWNHGARRPDWSSGPSVQPVQAGKPLSVPPFSLSFVTLPLGGADLPVPAVVAAPAAPAKSELRWFGPDSGFAGEEIELWVRAFEQGTDRPSQDRSLPDATLTADGQAVLQPASVRLREAAGRTLLRVPRPGVVALRARSGELTVSKQLTIKPAEPRPMLIWDAEEPELTVATGYETEFSIVKDTSARANDPVVRVDLKDAAALNKHMILRLPKLPPAGKLDRSAIRGVFLDIKLSPDFKCEDLNARIAVIVQSQADYWMDLGGVSLNNPKALADWTHQQFMVTQEKHLKAMPYALNVWLQLQANKPATGSVYIDRVGLMVR